LRELKSMMVLVLALAVVSSPGCISQIPLRRYDEGFVPDDSLDGCPDLAGTYEIAGDASEYLIAFQVLGILPLPFWWERDPQQPRLDMDLGLVFQGGLPIRVAGAKSARLSQPNSNRLLITLADDSGQSVEGYEEIVFARRRPQGQRLENRARDFKCWNGKFSFEIEETPYSWYVDLGRLPDGSLVAKVIERNAGAFIFIARHWHRYEEVQSSNPSP
jgi:hypothetical protein